jgi:hypothetical protein
MASSLPGNVRDPISERKLRATTDTSRLRTTANVPRYKMWRFLVARPLGLFGSSIASENDGRSPGSRGRSTR